MKQTTQTTETNQNLLCRTGVKSVTIGSKIYITMEEVNSFSYRTNVLTFPMKEAAKIIRNGGYDRVRIFTEWNEDVDERTPEYYIKKAEKLAKEAGYTSDVKLVNKHEEMDGIRKEWTEVEGYFNTI